MRFQGTDTYVATPDLMLAVNAAIALERPLLVKGEPGTGKTMLAEEVARALGRPLIQWHIKSTTKAQQGLYEYDAVSRLRDSQLGVDKVADIANYIKRGVLWDAFEADAPAVVLIDEVDKADIEFPNDLLRELDRMEFYVYETQRTVKARHRPLVVITSNNEKELPDAFLRRCFFHYIRFPDRETMTRIVDVHFPGLKKALLAEALEVFFGLRDVPGLKKKPSTSELLDWLKLLLAEDIPPEALQQRRPEGADPAAARRAAQERAGRPPVRARRVHGAHAALAMAFVLPVTLEGRHATLVPLAREHAGALAAAAADGELWRLWYTGVPAPEQAPSWVDAALAMREGAGAMPFVVRDNATGDIVGSTRYFNVEAAHRRLEIGHTWYARRVQRTAHQHRVQAAAADARVRDARLHRRRVPHQLLQLPVAQRDRAAGREAGRHPAPAPDPARRHAARHRRVQHHRRRVAGGEAAPSLPAGAISGVRHQLSRRVSRSATGWPKVRV